jgi:uncharacterized circularly permuted ATP-grasp superfamily protein
MASMPAAPATPFDELAGLDGLAAVAAIRRWLAATEPETMGQLSQRANELFRERGITFRVYGDESGTERLIPFDLVPRVISATAWRRIEAGCIQRVTALNRFLADIYGEQRILAEGVIPAAAVLDNAEYCVAMRGVRPPKGVHAHICGVDLVCTGPDQWFVLEDNCRTPSGVSYMLENRVAMQRVVPDLFRSLRIAPVAHYPDLLLQALRSCGPAEVDEPTAVIWTPGSGNSAYFEHSFLAGRMGVPLVEGNDLFVADGRVWMHSIRGREPVDVIYRRLDDGFLDPCAFRKDSVLGVPHLFDVVKAGRVTVANAIGNGVADDKSMYPYVPEMIRFYLGEEPILANVPTWRCREPEALRHVVEHLDELVVKEAHGSGGYGMLVGPRASKAEVAAFRDKLLAKPEAYIAQPTLALSTCPTAVDDGLAPRHIDLRPYVLTGADGSRLVPGGLTRVALKAGSLVVNSSQGGGTKDTWVLED